MRPLVSQLTPTKDSPMTQSQRQWPMAKHVWMQAERLLPAFALATALTGIASAQGGSNFSIAGGIQFSPHDGTNGVVVSSAALGITAADDIVALSAGLDPLDKPLRDIVFSVAPGAQGTMGSAVAIVGAVSRANAFFTRPPVLGSNLRTFSGFITNVSCGVPDTAVPGCVRAHRLRPHLHQRAPRSCDGFGCRNVLRTGYGA